MISNNTLIPQLNQISQITQKRYQEVEDVGVLAGLSGIALFHFYYGKYLDEDAPANVGIEILEHSMDRINEGYTYPTYCNGIAGFGWVLQHLVDHQFVELNLDELLGPFDDYLHAQMVYDLNHGNYDFLHGALGYGFYFLKRYSGTEGVTKEKYAEYLRQLVGSIASLGLRENGTIKWKSTLSFEKENKGFNLSLSHGMSSIIYLLSKLFVAGIDKQRIRELIKGASNYIVSFEDGRQSNRSFYPSWIEPGQALNYNSRLAWCYGDIGIGLALERAAKILEDKELEEKAIKVLLDTSKRRAAEDTLVMDAGYCHGSFGNANIFHTLYLSKKATAYKEASLFWMQDGLDRHTGIKQEPFRQWKPSSNTWHLELNLLEGLSGIGLCIIDYLSGKPNTWNECLMLR